MGGRIVECELGWRAEYAYSYALTVFTNDDRIAGDLRRLYLVDVDVAPALVPRTEEEEDEEPDVMQRAGTVLTAVKELRKELTGLRADPKPVVRVEALEPWCLLRRAKSAVTARDVATTLRDQGHCRGDTEASVSDNQTIEVGIQLQRLVYTRKVVQFRALYGGVTLWAPAPVAKKATALLEEANYVLHADVHAKEDAAALRALAATVAASTDAFVPARDVFASMQETKRPASVHRLAQSLIRNRYRGFAKPFQDRGSTVKRWGITSAGLASLA